MANGGFEEGLAGGRNLGRGHRGHHAHRGSCAAIVGTGAGMLYRDVAISGTADRAVASVWVKGVGAGNLLSHYRASVVDPSTGHVLDSGAGGSASSIDWTHVVWDLARFRGTTVQLQFAVGALGGAMPTLYVDDASVCENADLFVAPATDSHPVFVEVAWRHMKTDRRSLYMSGDSFTIQIRTHAVASALRTCWALLLQRDRAPRGRRGTCRIHRNQ